jgi:hypothetical protein
VTQIDEDIPVAAGAACGFRLVVQLWFQFQKFSGKRVNVCKALR